MARKLRVLIVEDSEDDAKLLVREIRKGGFEIVFERVETSESMAEALERQEWDIVISDHGLPTLTSLAALRVLASNGQDIPFIIVSGYIREDVVAEVMKVGARDCIPKDDLTRLIPAIEHNLREAA